MERREFTTRGAAGIAALVAFPGAPSIDWIETRSGPGRGTRGGSARGLSSARYQSIRDRFPRLQNEVFVNAAGGTPLGDFAGEAIDRYVEMSRLGRTGERAEWWGGVWDGVRGRFARLIGAHESEIGLVECTKAGEQIVLDGVAATRPGSSIVTNDLHFSGSLHNLEGIRRSGRDVRIVRSRDFRVSLERMADSIDDDTALVTVSLVSNVNGHREDLAELSEVAHAHGAIVFADVIQAAGIVPIDVDAMGIDVAACSSYKWLWGIHGAGFLYVREELQGTVIPDRLFPGHVQRTYAPFAQDGASGSMTYTPPNDARRYQPGHVNYLGYAAAHAGLGFIEEVGVERMLEHTVRLNRRLVDQLDGERFRTLSSHPDTSPILALEARDVEGLRGRLVDSEVVVSTGGDKWNLVRVSPAIYNTEADIDRLAEVMDG
jgi:selenocysteine lyase/cysteine desulfurase